MTLIRAAFPTGAVVLAMIGCTDAGSDGSGGSNGTGETVNVGASATSSKAASTAATGAQTGATSTSTGVLTPTCEDPSGVVPPAAWANVTGNLAGMASECGNLTIVQATPCTAQIIAGVAQKGLWQTTDGGTSWTELGSGAGSATITNRPSSVVHDPAHPGVFWTSGIYNGAGVYRSDDDGTTFVQLGDIGHNDLVAVDFADPDRKTLLAGGHEQKRTLHRSADGGQTWTNVGENLPGDSHFSSYPVVLDANTHLVGACGWGDGTCGIYRTTDGGASWAQVSDLHAQSAPLRASDGAIYWPLGDGKLARSIDQGASFSELATSLANVTPVELPDGRIVSMRENRLAISSDQGDTWSAIGEAFPFQPAGLTYASATRTFYIWHWDCGNVVLSDAIQSAGFDYLTQ